MNLSNPGPRDREEREWPRTDEAARQLVEYVASMKDCHQCYPEGVLRGRSGLCPKHRDPVLLCNGFLHGWTHPGGIPINYSNETES